MPLPVRSGTVTVIVFLVLTGIYLTVATLAGLIPVSFALARVGSKIEQANYPLLPGIELAICLLRVMPIMPRMYRWRKRFQNTPVRIFNVSWKRNKFSRYLL